MELITVIICTHNRSQVLDRVIDSLFYQTLQINLFTILIVDNASTDNTYEVVELKQIHLTNLCYIYEPMLGLSNARNRGIKESNSPYVVFLDDDAYPEPQWLEKILSDFKTVNPFPHVIGGPVYLDWGGNPPNWLPKSFWSIYSYVDWGPTNHFTKFEEYFVGANMAFNKEILLQNGGFNGQLGRIGCKLLSGEETELFNRLRYENANFYYDHEAVVHHIVSKARQKHRWFFARIYWEGFSQAILDFSSGMSQVIGINRLIFDIKMALLFLSEGLFFAFSGRKSKSFDRVIKLIQRLGRIRAETSLLMRVKK